ncbi:MAG: hypothetical protein C0518_06135 [Opitutus sp.]|nr:hypothetical protein [Opitutus sp.]
MNAVAQLASRRAPQLFALIFAFGVAGSAVAQRATLADGLKAAVLRADEARVYAMLAPDVGALDDMLTADCLYAHSNGSTQTKAEFLDALKSGAMKYAVIRYIAPPQVRLYGTETALLNGTTQIEVALPDGRTAKPTLFITAVYVVKDGRWQLASYQSTTVPAAK